MEPTNEEYIDALWIDREANQEKIKELEAKIESLKIALNNEQTLNKRKPKIEE